MSTCGLDSLAPHHWNSIDWAGWLDDSHLVTGFYQSSDDTPSVVDLTSGAVTPVAAHGIVAAIFPSDLEA